MKKIPGKSKDNPPNIKLFTVMTLIFTLLLSILSAVACYYSYIEKKRTEFAAISVTLSQLENEYQDTLGNFWHLYMPIFEKNNIVYGVVQNYFSPKSREDLDPQEKLELTDALSRMIARNNKITWLAFYSPDRMRNYILFNDNTALTMLADDFPWFDEIKRKSSQMEVYGTKMVSNGPRDYETFVVCGGVPQGMGKGMILAGYGIPPYLGICEYSNENLQNISFFLASNGAVIFYSNNNYASVHDGIIKKGMDGIYNITGEKEYIKTTLAATNSSILGVRLSWNELFKYAHGNTPFILSMTLSFIALSLFVRRMINRMNTNLNRNIERVHEFEIKQKESELSELQAKFNPHFLYNTLEMLRGKARENGDETTAELITQLASIFRGHIGIKTFIPFKEELTFSRHYLALLRARYGDRTRVLYDIDTGLLNYGIIHNTLQILIENYFVHGFNALNGDNRILFRGKSIDEKTMLITVEDNGNGMDDGNIEKLNAALDENTTQRTESYGLKNLHQRLKLFYGPGCGLHITKNRDQGLRVEIRLSKITVREYEEHGIKSASES